MMSTPLPQTIGIDTSKATLDDLHAALTEYIAVYKQTYGQDEPLVELVPYMLAAFLASDRGFAKARDSLTAGGR